LQVPKILSSRYEKIKVALKTRPFVYSNYTAKIVKSFLICLNPKFEEPLSSEGGYKEIHVTPLLDEEGKAIYPKKVVTCSFCKDKKPKGPVKVAVPSKVYFEVAGPRELVEELFNYGSCMLKVGEKEVPFEIVGAERLEPWVELGEALLIKFRGPAVLRDPWTIGMGLRSRFLPTPSNLLAVNAYALFKNRMEEVLLEVERSLVEDHSALHSLGKVWYYYDNRWLPALTGTLLLWVKKDSEIVNMLINHASLFGVGSGRAAGFGDVVIKNIGS